MDRAAEERARRRRQEWSGEVVRSGTPKGALYAHLSPEERLEAMAALQHRVWGEVPPLPRAEWPGEVFRLP